MSDDGQATGGDAGSAIASAPKGGLGSQAGLSQPAAKPADMNVDWRTSIANEEIRNSPTIQQLKASTASEAIDRLSEMTINAQRMIGMDKIPKLKEGATPEDRLNYFREHFGVPQEKEQYTFDLPEDAPDDAKEVAELFQNISHENGLLPDQAKALYEKLGDFFQEKQTAAMEAQKTKITEGLNQLRDQLGERFETHLHQANSAAERLGGEELSQFLAENPAVSNNPAIINAFQRAAMMMMDNAPAGLNSSYAAGKVGQHAIQDFENSPQWKGLLQKVLKNDATPSERREYERLVEQRTMLYEQAGA